METEVNYDFDHEDHFWQCMFYRVLLNFTLPKPRLTMPIALV